jgi:hypothetical protein
MYAMRCWRDQLGTSHLGEVTDVAASECVVLVEDAITNTIKTATNDGTEGGAAQTNVGVTIPPRGVGRASPGST